MVEGSGIRINCNEGKPASGAGGNGGVDGEVGVIPSAGLDASSTIGIGGSPIHGTVFQNLTWKKPGPVKLTVCIPPLK